MPRKLLSIMDLQEGDTVEFKKLFNDYADGENAEAEPIRSGTKARVMKIENDKFIHITTQGKKEHKITFGSNDTALYLRLPKSKNKQGEYAHDDVASAIVNGDRVIVELKNGFKGVAVCDQFCVFNYVTGYNIAYNKAKKKEANYNYRHDKAAYESTIIAAEKMIENIEKNYNDKVKKHDFYIRKAMSTVKEKPQPKVPF